MAKTIFNDMKKDAKILIKIVLYVKTMLILPMQWYRKISREEVGL